MADVKPWMEAADWFVLSTSGDGANAFLVPADKLHAALHEEMCTCGDDWKSCKTEGVVESVAALDHPDNWTNEYPDYKPNRFTLDFEDGGIQIIRITDDSFIAAHAPADSREQALATAEEAYRFLDTYIFTHNDFFANFCAGKVPPFLSDVLVDFANGRALKSSPADIDNAITEVAAFRPERDIPGQSSPAPPRRDPEDHTLEERDEYHEFADKLARGISEHFGVDIGEHSSANNPWQVALDILNGEYKTNHDKREQAYKAMRDQLEKLARVQRLELALAVVLRDEFIDDVRDALALAKQTEGGLHAHPQH